MKALPRPRLLHIVRLRLWRKSSFITHLVLPPKRLAFLGTLVVRLCFLTDGVTGSSPVWGANNETPSKRMVFVISELKRTRRTSGTEQQSGGLLRPRATPSARRRANRESLFGAPKRKHFFGSAFSMKRTLRCMKSEAGLRPMKRSFAARLSTGASLRLSTASAS